MNRDVDKALTDLRGLAWMACNLAAHTEERFEALVEFGWGVREDAGIFRVIRMYGQEGVMLESCFRMIRIIKSRRSVGQAVKDLVDFTDLSIAAGFISQDQAIDRPTAVWLVTNDTLFPPLSAAK